MNPLFPILFNLSILIALTALHLFWLLGGKTGLKYAYPKNSNHRKKFYKPGFIILFITVVTLAAMTWVCVAQTGSYRYMLTDTAIIWGNRGIAVVFLARAIGNFKYMGFTKTLKGTEFAQLDTYIYSPVSLAMALCAVISSSYIY